MGVWARLSSEIGIGGRELTQRDPARHDWPSMAAFIMLGTLFGLIALIFALVLRYDPEARAPRARDR